MSRCVQTFDWYWIYLYSRFLTYKPLKDHQTSTSDDLGWLHQSTSILVCARLTPLLHVSCDVDALVTLSISNEVIPGWAWWNTLSRCSVVTCNMQAVIQCPVIYLRPFWLSLFFSPKASHYHHRAWPLVWGSYCRMQCLVFARHNGTHVIQKVVLTKSKRTLNHLDDHQDSWKNVIWTDDSKIYIFGWHWS